MDIDRLVEKMEEYIKMSGEKYGFYYLKDLVRIAVYYETV